MTEAIATAGALTPIGAVLVIAAIAQVAIVQLAKQQSWTRTRTQSVSVAVAAVLGALAALVLGMIAGVPESVIQIVSSVLLSIAAVAVLGRALYAVLGYVIPDGTTPDPDVVIEQVGDFTKTTIQSADGRVVEKFDHASAHGRRADRDGVMDGRDSHDASA